MTLHANPIDDVEIFGAKGDACLQVGDTIALCLQREGKFFCVGSEGFVDLAPWDVTHCVSEVAFERGETGGRIGCFGFVF